MNDNVMQPQQQDPENKQPASAQQPAYPQPGAQQQPTYPQPGAQKPAYPQSRVQQPTYQQAYPVPPKKKGLGAGAIVAIVLGSIAVLTVFAIVFVSMFGLLLYDYDDYDYDSITVDGDDYYVITDYYFDRLSAEQKQVYYCLSQGAGEYVFDEMLDLTSNDVFEVQIVFRNNHMTFPNMNGNETSIYFGGQAPYGVTKILISESFEMQEIIPEFEEAAAALLAQLPSELEDDYIKVKAIAELICEIAEYDYASLDDLPMMYVDGQKENIYLHYPASTDYGAIVNGKAICAGYSKAFQYLAEQLGVTSLLVCGDADNGSEVALHEWNLVLIDGYWYHIDVTWMDSTYINYDYFLVSDETLGKDHKAYNWYLSNGWGYEYNLLPAAPYDYQVEQDAA